jgi:hypothetical protein
MSQGISARKDNWWVRFGCGLAVSYLWCVVNDVEGCGELVGEKVW